MERGRNDSFGGHGSIFAGAIFLSNCMTKRECFQRKLFGLPSSQSGFVKKVKMGMILFLFEYEERKLHGVFEATSDGALNIVPNAYLESGKSFPAQVHFKTIWSCDPLYEDEFNDAIKENYFTPTKFNFGLTYEQVARLVQLFSLKKKKKINSSEYQDFRVHNKFMKYSNFGLGKRRIIKDRRFMKPERHICKTGNGIDYTAFTDSSYFNTNHSSSCEKRVQTSEDYAVGGAQHRLYLPVPHDFDSGHSHLIRPSENNLALEPRALNLTRSTSSSGHLRGKIFDVRPSVYDRFSYYASGSMSKQSPTLGVHNQALYQDITFHARSSKKNVALPFRNQPNPSQPNLKTMPNPKTIALPSNDHMSLETTTKKEHYEGPVYVTPRASLSSVDPEGYNDLQVHNDFHTSGMFAAEGLDSLDCPEASQHDDGTRGYSFLSRFSTECTPLSKDEDLMDNRVFSRFRRSSEAQQHEICGYSSKFQEMCSSNEQRAFHSTSSYKYHPTTETSDLCSYFSQERISAFCRLSEVPQIRFSHSYGPETNISLDDHVGLLSQRTPQRSKMTKGQRQPFIQVNYEQLQSKNEIGFTESVSLGNMEENNKVMAEEGIELSFMNFKRRSEIRKTDSKTETNDHLESGGKIKRRKLVRPSFIEEEPIKSECRNTTLAQQNVGSHTISVDGEGKGSTEIHDSLMRTHDNNGNENIVESVKYGACSCATKENSENLSACRCSILSTGALQEKATIHGEYKGDGEKLKKLVSSLVGEKDTAHECEQNAAYIIASADIQIMNHEGSRRKKCHDIDEKNKLTFDGNLEKFSFEYDVDCAKLSAKNRNEKAEAKLELSSYENTSLLHNGEYKCKQYDDKDAGNWNISDGNIEKNLLKSDTDDSYKKLEVRRNGKHEPIVINNDNELLLVDDVNCGNKLSDIAVERNAITSNANKSDILIGRSKHEENKAESSLKATGFNSVFSVDCNFEGQDPVGLDIGNRPFSFNQGKFGWESDDFLSLDVEMS